MRERYSRPPSKSNIEQRLSWAKVQALQKADLLDSSEASGFGCLNARIIAQSPSEE